MADAPVLINDPRVLAIEIHECFEQLVPLCDSGLTLYQHAGSNVPITNLPQFSCRSGVRDRLIAAGQSLPTGIVLAVSECFRPLSLQSKYWEGTLARLQNQYPDWNGQQVAAEAAKFVAPPWITPPHSTGGAADVLLLTENGEELDMGSGLDQQCPEMMTNAPGLSQIARSHRQMLVEAMTAAGFVNYPHEWWHYSFGDRYWAYMTEAPNAIYGSK